MHVGLGMIGTEAIDHNKFIMVQVLCVSLFNLGLLEADYLQPCDQGVALV